jgi:hypothetical protein
MVAEYGNLLVILPYALITAAGVVFIMIAMRGDRKPPSTPNLTARRKHPLRHLQVELNRAREVGRAKQRDEKAEEKEKSEEKPRRPKRRRDGPGGLRRVR